MFVAPLVLPTSRTTARPPAFARVRDRTVTRMTEASTGAPLLLLIWLASGLLVLWCVPAARGSGPLGATLPFWLIAAPLLDLGWLWRARLARVLARAYRRLSIHGLTASRVRHYR